MIERISPLKPFGLSLEMRAGTRAADLPRADLLGLVGEHKLVLVRGLAPLDREELLRFAARDPERELVQWSFGPVMEMRADPHAENYLFSHEEVPLHWDGAFHLEPRTLVFHCVQPPDPALGGETTFVDSEAVWAKATAAERARWKKITLAYETEKKAHYGGRVEVPMVQHHPDKPVTILRYAEPVASALNPVKLEVRGLRGPVADFLGEMRTRLYSEPYLYSHRWEQNDLLLADNFSLLHGRRAFADASPRHLRRVQIR